MPLQATSGAASYDAFGGGVPFEPIYIEQVFQNWLYTGNGSTQTITNGIDLAGKGGLVWLKSRSAAADHLLIGQNPVLEFSLTSNSTAAQSATYAMQSFNSNGFTMNTSLNANVSGTTYASWTFRKQPKFFDVVTWTGNSISGTTIPHNLGSAPGCVIIKSTSNTVDWFVYHQSLGAANFLNLNLTAAATASEAMFGPGNPAPSSTVITLGNSNATNGTGRTYVAYLFAHNAGGFGLTGTDNVISCGSYNRTDGVKSVVNLGFEPQFIIQKTATAGSQWTMLDVMRGWTGASNSNLFANLSNAETTGNIGIMPTATGFEDYTTAGATDTIIYIAIRRGPMRTPTTGTSVFHPFAYAGSGAGTYTTGINQDLFFAKSRGSSSYVWNWYDRLRGPNLRLQSNATNAEAANTGVTAFNNTSMVFGASDGFSSASPFGGPYIGYALTRAPGFFDEVCYTGTGVARTVAHNLAAVPELMIVKSRTNGSASWAIYHAALGNSRVLNFDTGIGTSDVFFWNNTTPTTSVFSVGIAAITNQSANNFVAYLFASCPGVSKVGSYTGNGSSQTINCGFTGGARFVMVKRTDSTGNWMVVDTARGLVSAGDPTLYLNGTTAEVTGVDWLDPDSSGFIVNQEGTMNANVNAATYIFLAIA